MTYKFDIYDYLVLIAVLLVSILIGFYHAISTKYGNRFKTFLGCKSKNTRENSQLQQYLIAGGSMSAFPISLSLLATFFSATALLGFPAEVYQYGIENWISAFSMMLAPIIGAYVTGPMFLNLKIVSVFEYLQLRYKSNIIRMIATSLNTFRAFITTAIFIYGPATTITALTDISVTLAVILIGSVATFYTTIGGIKAVIWTDVFQMTIMFIGLTSVICKGTYEVGGLNELLKINSNGGRLNLFDFNPNPFIRQSFWSLFIGMGIYFITPYSIDQQMLQRFSAAKNLKHAQMVLLLNVPGIFLIMTLCCFSGLVIYANYANCDPLSAPDLTNVKSPNQLMVYLVTDKMKSIKGFTGLFVSSILSGSLSSVSSSLNSMAAIIWQDFLKNFSFFNNMNDSNSTITLKIIVICIGTISTGLAIIISELGGSLIQISSSLNGSIGAPMTGVFLLAMIPFSNSYGAFFGMIGGFLMGLFMSYGAYVVKPVYPKLSMSTECHSNITTNTSFVLNRTTEFQNLYLGKEAINLTGLSNFFALSFTWFNTAGILVTVFVGISVSLLTSGYQKFVTNKIKRNEGTSSEKKKLNVTRL